MLCLGFTGYPGSTHCIDLCLCDPADTPRCVLGTEQIPLFLNDVNNCGVTWAPELWPRSSSLLYVNVLIVMAEWLYLPAFICWRMTVKTR